MKPLFHTLTLAGMLATLCACGNILEDSGPAWAKGETGELTISLQTDASLQVDTKATEQETEQEKNIKTYQGTLSVTMQAQADTKLPEGATLPTTAGTFTVPVGKYTLLAKNEKSMTTDFGWNYPVLASPTEPIEIKPGTQEAKLTCTLQNSIIAVNSTAWSTLLQDVEVTAFQVINTETVPAKGETITGGTSLLADNSQTQLKEGVLYVKPDLADVKIVLDGKLKSGTQASFRAAAPIKPSQTANDPIGKQNQYNVSFSLDQSKGQLVLSITVDPTLTPVEIVIPIIPE